MKSEISRFEYKYQVALTDYFYLRSRLARYATLDNFSRLGGGRYYVKSLYYDSPSYDAYYEKMNGDYFRKKIRLRTYTKTPEGEKFVNAEIKMKIGDTTTKRTSRLNNSQFEAITHQKYISDLDPTAEDFLRLIKSEYLKPLILIDYEREVWIPFQKSDLRISIDFNIRSAKSQELHGDLNWKHNYRGISVLEIKTAHPLPLWLEETIRDLSLKKESNSKYVNGLSHSIMVTHAL